MTRQEQAGMQWILAQLAVGGAKCQRQEQHRFFDTGHHRLQVFCAYEGNSTNVLLEAVGGLFWSALRVPTNTTSEEENLNVYL